MGAGSRRAVVCKYVPFHQAWLIWQVSLSNLKSGVRTQHGHVPQHVRV